VHHKRYYILGIEAGRAVRAPTLAAGLASAGI